MPIGNNIGEKVKSFTKIVQMSAEHQARLNVMPSAALSYAKIVQMSAEHQARLSVMPSAALSYAKIVFFLFLSSLAKKGSERCPFHSFLSSLAKKGTERRQR
jgi:hypothetical protein